MISHELVLILAQDARVRKVRGSVGFIGGQPCKCCLLIGSVTLSQERTVSSAESKGGMRDASPITGKGREGRRGTDSSLPSENPRSATVNFIIGSSKIVPTDD